MRTEIEHESPVLPAAPHAARYATPIRPAEFHCWYAADRQQALEKGRYLYGLYEKYLRAGPAVDLGCGEGALLLWMQTRGHQSVLGVEGNSELCALAQSFGVPVIQSDLLDYFRQTTREPASYFYLDVIEHVSFDFNTELFDLIPVGSRLIIQTPNTRSLPGHELYLNVPSHVAPYSPWVIEMMLHRAGYAYVAQGSIGGNLRTTWKNRLRAYLIRKVLGVDPELLVGGGNYFVVADRVRASA